MRKAFGQWLFNEHAWRVLDNIDFWVPHLNGFNQAIRRKHQDEYGTDVPERLLNVALGIDVKFYATTEVGDKDEAAAMYNGYEGCCGFKLQMVSACGGQCAALSNGYPGAHHDQFLLNHTQLNLKLRTAQQQYNQAHNLNVVFDLYGDKGYVNRPCIKVAHKAPRYQHLNPEQENENQAMKVAVSAFMETKFGRAVGIWRFTDSCKVLKVYDGRGKGQPRHCIHIVNSYLLDNCLIGFNDAGQTAYYGVNPVSCHDYLSYVKP